ncbi:hypothetical protein B0T13DRAFT_472029 [Neurospora crassa]|nr:hypothetical protein B0T13DRAFT_472029 [Neurospora crassa]
MSSLRILLLRFSLPFSNCPHSSNRGWAITPFNLWACVCDISFFPFSIGHWSCVVHVEGICWMRYVQLRQPGAGPSSGLDPRVSFFPASGSR